MTGSVEMIGSPSAGLSGDELFHGSRVEVKSQELPLRVHIRCILELSTVEKACYQLTPPFSTMTRPCPNMPSPAPNRIGGSDIKVKDVNSNTDGTITNNNSNNIK